MRGRDRRGRADVAVPAGAGLALLAVLVTAGGWVELGTVARWVWSRGWWLLGWGLVVASLVVAVVRSVRRARPAQEQPVTYRVLSPWAIAAGAGAIVLVGVVMAVWLLVGYAGGSAEASRVRLDALRTAGTMVVGAGGAAALLLAARRQRSAEIALKQKDRDQAHQEHVAEDMKTDAEARRITELYTRAVEQLGSEKAPVRLGGLYALERLAQDHVEQRQTIVNVLCAYLRMPYAPPLDTAPLADEDEAVVRDYQQRVQEREVRLTAQRLLADHLNPGPDRDAPAATFWTDIDLDLTGATLITFTLTGCTLRTADFRSATFTGRADFESATFTDRADFRSALFTNYADFASATFTDRADFRSAIFTNYADFESATFADYADFLSATFNRYAAFRSATFTDHAAFESATFTSYADFRSATFADETDFRSASLTGDTNFEGAAFARGVPTEVKLFWSAAEDDGA